jgi:Glycine rich protein
MSATRHLRLRLVASVGAALALVAGLALTSGTEAGAANQSFTSDGTFVVPSGVTTISVTLTGAAGGSCLQFGSGGAAGRGAIVTADLPVTPGSTLNIFVGSRGTNASNGSVVNGGANGGGNGGGQGSGGGGATDIRSGGSALPNRIAVAGGGGGCYYSGGANGGAGGTPNGLGGGSVGPANVAGGGGTQSAGGAGGVSNSSPPYNGAAGTLGLGGGGFVISGNAVYGGAGGGGGYYGGGGAAYAGGAGGGGSSYVVNTASNVTYTVPPSALNQGSVDITWTVPPSTTTTTTLPPSTTTTVPSTPTTTPGQSGTTPTGGYGTEEATSLTTTESGSVTITGRNWKPGTMVGVTVYSDPVELGSVLADSSGAISQAFVLPSSISAGRHTVRLTGFAASGVAASVDLALTVNAPIPLAVTG